MICIILLIATIVLKFVYDLKIQEIDYKNMIKSNSQLLGKHLYIDRDNKEAVDVNWNEPQSNDKLPLIINLHGDAFIAGDADTLDTQSTEYQKTGL